MKLALILLASLVAATPLPRPDAVADAAPEAVPDPQPDAYLEKRQGICTDTRRGSACRRWCGGNGIMINGRCCCRGRLRRKEGEREIPRVNQNSQ
jgi:hypothetical protein